MINRVWPQRQRDLIVTINIPRLQRSYLTNDSYLKFTVNLKYKPNPNGGTLYAQYPFMFDVCGAYGVFDKIEVFDYLGSTLLESTAGHAQLVTLLQQMTTSQSEYKHFWGANAGLRAGFIQAANPGQHHISNTYYSFKLNDQSSVAAKATGLDWTPPQTGEILNDAPASAAGSYVYVAREYCIPLLSFLGLLSPKFSPLHNGFTIVLTTHPQATTFGISNLGIAGNYGTTAGTTPAATIDLTAGKNTTDSDATITYSDFSYCCQVLELGPQAEELLLGSTGGNPLVIPTKAFRNYIGTIPAGNTTFRLDLNLNVASLTNILWFMRNSSIIASDNRRSISERIRNYLQSWYFQYGSSILPQTAGIQARSKNVAEANRPGFSIGTQAANTSTKFYTDHSECYNELMKSRHLFTESMHPTTFTMWDYIKDIDTTTTAIPVISTSSAAPALPYNYLGYDNPEAPGCFACGLDLELVSGRSNDLVCGMNTNGINTSIYATFDPVPAAANTITARVDAYCEYDAFINIVPGVATTVSF